MHLIYNNEFEKYGGIYRITNKVNGKVYIGSAKNFRKRANDHKNFLSNNKHHNQHLQASWNLHGPDAFIFEIIEVVAGNKKDRTTREQYYIDQYYKNNNWENCYNICKKVIVDELDLVKLTNFKKTISQIKKEFYQTEKGKEIIKKLTNYKIGKTYEEIYGIKRATEIKKKISDDKIIVINKPLFKKRLSKQLKGKSFEERFGEEKAKQILEKISKGRKGKYTSKESSRYRVIKNIKLLSPDGKIYTEINGLKDFAVLHGLRPNHLCELFQGKRKSHKNWKLLPI